MKIVKYQQGGVVYDNISDEELAAYENWAKANGFAIDAATIMEPLNTRRKKTFNTLKRLRSSNEDPYQTALNNLNKARNLYHEDGSFGAAITGNTDESTQNAIYSNAERFDDYLDNTEGMIRSRQADLEALRKMDADEAKKNWKYYKDVFRHDPYVSFPDVTSKEFTPLLDGIKGLSDEAKTELWSKDYEQLPNESQAQYIKRLRKQVMANPEAAEFIKNNRKQLIKFVLN